MSQSANRLRVCVDTTEEPVLVGTLDFNPALRRRAGISTTFTYDPTWLARPDAYAIDPQLSLFGRSSTVAGLPGCFQDCSPDRWGRTLIEKRLRALALQDGTGQRTITDVDYLLGVADLSRQGALRLRHVSTTEPTAPSGAFVDPHTVVPTLIELPRLLAAADAAERDPDDQTAVKDLLDAGSGSLGGARPKASVRDGDQLMLAKFPHHDDTWDVMAWEATALDLAERAGIAVPRRRLTRINRRAVLILDRFDRTPAGLRLPYISAMTLLGRADGEVADYTDLCDAISDEGAATLADLEALWRRVAFSVAIHNTDDHLRNHGFTRAPGGWTLSPAFDINPNPDTASVRVTGIDGARKVDDESLGLASLQSNADWTRDAARRSSPRFKTSWLAGRASHAPTASAPPRSAALTTPSRPERGSSPASPHNPLCGDGRVRRKGHRRPNAERAARSVRSPCGRNRQSYAVERRATPSGRLARIHGLRL